MRRRGGLVIAVILLLTAGCTPGEPAAIHRSAAITNETLPAAEHIDNGSAPDTASPATTPETVRDLGVELADTGTTEPEASPPTSNSATTTTARDRTESQPRAVLLDPVPVGATRAEPRSAPVVPSGPTSTGHIEIPAIGLSHPTYEGISLDVIDYGPSHWPGTARPGHLGNTVFPGHRTTHSAPFYYLDELVPGDAVIFTTREGRFTYRVTQSFVVDDEETWIVEPTSDATFTIFACHPKGSAQQRFVVTGDLVSTPATPPTTAPPPPPPTTRPTTTTTEPSGGLLDILFG